MEPDDFTQRMSNAMGRLERSVSRLTDLIIQLPDSQVRTAMAYNMRELSQAQTDLVVALNEAIHEVAEERDV